MARPTKVRNVQQVPQSSAFIPEGKKRCSVTMTQLKVEELEALRLKDLEGLSQEECAKEMDVSRQTFQNILNSARKKITESLVNGHGIAIGGGNFKTPNCQFVCLECSQEYIPTLKKDLDHCPNCNSENIICSKTRIKCKKVCKIKVK